MAGYILYSTPNEEKDKEIKELELQEKKEVYGLNEEYRKLGEAYFEKNKLCQDVPEEFNAYFDAIKAKKAAIKQCREKVMAFKKVKMCPYCNSEIPQESIFCIMCGKKVQEIQPQKMENTVTCKYCGTVLPAGSKFCGCCARSLVGEVAEKNTLLKDINAVDTEDENAYADKSEAEMEIFESDTSENIESMTGDFSDEEYANQECQSEEYADEECESQEYTDEKEYKSEEYADEECESQEYTDEEEQESEEYTDEETEDEEDLYATVAANTGWNAVKICPRCNKKMDRFSKFCTGCGMRL
jgi:cobalamin biosynthesis protein CobT